jgi:hypothetical protein
MTCSLICHVHGMLLPASARRTKGAGGGGDATRSCCVMSCHGMSCVLMAAHAKLESAWMPAQRLQIHTGWDKVDLICAP